MTLKNDAVATMSGGIDVSSISLTPKTSIEKPFSSYTSKRVTISSGSGTSIATNAPYAGFRRFAAVPLIASPDDIVTQQYPKPVLAPLRTPYTRRAFAIAKPENLGNKPRFTGTRSTRRHR